MKTPRSSAPLIPGTALAVPILAMLLGAVLSARAQVAPQDAHYLLISITDQGSMYTPYLSRDPGGDPALDRIYFRWASGATGGIRAVDLEGNLQLDFATANFNAGDVYRRQLAVWNGTIYSAEVRSNGDKRVYMYDASTGNATGSFGPDGPEPATGNFDFDANGSFHYSALKVSPVTGNVYVVERSFWSPFGTHEPLVSGVILAFDSAGNPLAENIQTNGILAESLEGNIHDFWVVPGHDGMGEIWVRGRYSYGGTQYSQVSQWLKVFKESDPSDYRLFDLGSDIDAAVYDDFVFFRHENSHTGFAPATAQSINDRVGAYRWISFGQDDAFLGRANGGRLVDRRSNTAIDVYQTNVFRTFEPANAVPNPVVEKIEQRPGSAVIDIDYRVEDEDDSTVETAAVAFVDGNQTLPSLVSVTQFVEGTGANLGAGIDSNTRHRISWDPSAGDWSLDFGNLSVMILARDSRGSWFDVHFVTIPADSDAGYPDDLAISRNPLQESDFTMQWLWLVATNDTSIVFDQSGGGLIKDAMDPSVELVDNSGLTTPQGRAFLLARDGLGVAQPGEVVRAREGATAGYIVQNDPPIQIRPPDDRDYLPHKINEYGIESRTSNYNGWDFSENSTNLWYVKKLPPPAE